VVAPAAYASDGSVSEYIRYCVTIVDPALVSPTAGQGAPRPMDIVDSAYRFADFYGPVPNDNDCDKIAQDLAGAAGATLNDEADSLNPRQNAESGFWRIAYRGSDPGQVSDWQTLCQPGDIVRMGWTGGGHHTTTVLRVNPDGSMLVYDNNDDGVIGIHTERYDQVTLPGTITIYRLTTDGFYLTNGTGLSESLAGSTYDDQMLGFAGADSLRGGLGADLLEGGLGDDVLVGGVGDDTLSGGVGSDTAAYGAASGAVTVSLAIVGPQHVGADGVDSLAGIENLLGSAFGDVLGGSAVANRLDGNAGDDLLSGLGGADTLIGGAGADTLAGGVGGDTLSGGAGADVFRFSALAASLPGSSDLIVGLQRNDVIDLSGIDADATAAGDQAFVLVGALDGHAAQLALVADTADGLTLLEGDVDGDGQADVTVRLQGAHLSFGNFVL
jgi:Ca2+-binding RTX toxin-like protein